MGEPTMAMVLEEVRMLREKFDFLVSLLVDDPEADDQEPALTLDGDTVPMERDQSQAL